mgnify:FL=1|tara:strand:+ start:1204 stop:1848 length:645 start_codon:yes stop_codon:yes gene_type:complete
MIRQKHLVLTLEHCFKMKILINYMVIISIFFIEISKINAQEKTIEKKPTANLESILPIAVIDMQKVLSKSTAWASLQKEMQTLEKSFKDEIKTEEDKLKKEQEKLLAQKSVVTDDQFKEKEKSFKAKVNKVQSKVENIKRDLEGTMAKGMQIIQREAIKLMKEIAQKEGYLVVFDATSTVIVADKINISERVADKLNKSLPSINIERKKENKVD